MRVLSRLWRLSFGTLREFVADSGLGLAGGIAFYALLSMAPLLVIVIALAGAVWGSEAAHGQIVAEFRGLMGDQAADMIEEVIQRAGEQPQRGVLATTLGILMLLVGAIGVFGQIKVALNAIWNVDSRITARPRPVLRRPLWVWSTWRFLRARLISFAMVICIAFLLLVSLAVNAAMAALGGWFEASTGLSEAALWAANTIAALAVTTVLFAAMFKLLPDAPGVRWRDVWVAAVTTAALFAVGKHLIGLYLGTSAVVSVYGAAGSLVLILLWVYYSAVILLLGAQFTQTWARERCKAEGESCQGLGMVQRA